MADKRIGKKLDFTQVKVILSATGKYADITQNPDGISAWDQYDDEFVHFPMFGTLTEVVKFIAAEAEKAGYEKGKVEVRENVKDALGL